MLGAGGRKKSQKHTFNLGREGKAEKRERNLYILLMFHNYFYILSVLVHMDVILYNCFNSTYNYILFFHLTYQMFSIFLLIFLYIFNDHMIVH